MRIEELRSKLASLKSAGYIASERSGPTGVGHTLEWALGLTENNLPIPDIGGRTEVKATRISASSLITLFTYDRSVWNIPQAEAVERFGYVNGQGRLALKSTVSAAGCNVQGLKLVATNGPEMAVSIVHDESGIHLATWSIFHLVGKFVTKFERLLLVRADSRKQPGMPEEFRYVEAELVSEPGDREFLRALREGSAVIDIRMHLLPSGSVRNRGTAIRIRERDLASLFSNRIQLL